MPPSFRSLGPTQPNDYILVVDDFAELRKLVREMLEADGHEVITCDNALGGFTAILELGPPKLLICDQRMPEGGPGLRLLDYCAEHHAGTQRILFTGYFDGAIALAGANHVVIEKGSDLRLLRTAVRKALSGTE